MSSEWIRPWPQSPGMYWLHGWIYSDQQLQQPSTYLVKAHRDHQGVLSFSTCGVILRDTEGCRGVWTAAEVPSPPPGTRL